MRTIALSAACLTLVLSAGALVAEELDEATKQRHKQFEETLSGATLTGNFTIDGKDAPAKEESYTIKKVTWLDIDDLWRFDVHMKYGNVDKTFALAVPVKWAGDTAVISLTKTTIPGMGSFSAKVVIDGDRYAGTWDHHGAGGGHMFGKITKTEAKE